jgi:hypothetical protein
MMMVNSDGVDDVEHGDDNDGNDDDGNDVGSHKTIMYIT